MAVLRWLLVWAVAFLANYGLMHLAHYALGISFSTLALPSSATAVLMYFSVRALTSPRAKQR